MTAPAKGRLELERRIGHTIDEALEFAHLGGGRIAADKLAMRVFDENPDLMREVQRAWSIERLTAMIRRRRRELLTNAHPEQMVLDDPIFRDLPRSVFLRDGRRPRLDYCTVTEVEDHLKLLRQRLKNHARINQMEAVVELHHKWAAKYPGITWEKAQRREAEERAR